ncbi:MAG: hypothetical protein ABI862_02625 [Ilumatobacteraceae bacterium]
MRAAERDEADYLDDVHLPHDHPSRAIDALRVLRVLTDRSSGSTVASATSTRRAVAPTTCAPIFPRCWPRSGRSNRTKRSATRHCSGRTPRQPDRSTN